MRAFRCKTCGHMVRAEAAGDAPTPTACPVCGSGVKFAPNGVHTFEPQNWEVLADATPERLTDLGLTPAEVERHTPTKKGMRQLAQSQALQRIIEDGAGTEDHAG